MVLLDKTGTVTTGRPVVTDVVPASGVDESTLLAAAASVERLSEHPIARAIVERADGLGLPRCVAVGFTAEPGHGARAHVDGSEVLVGTAAFVAESNRDSARPRRRRHPTGRRGKDARVRRDAAGAR